MARRLAIIPEELMSSYQFQKPEIRLETQIESLLDSGKLLDDVKAKLLSQLITRYQKVVHTPPEPVRVTIEKETPDQDSQSIQKSKMGEEPDLVYQSILASTAHNLKKFIPMIKARLKSRGYAWNSDGELTYEGNLFQGTSVSDFFFFISRDGKKLVEPYGINHFLRALKFSKIPQSWILNKKALKFFKKTDIPSSGEELTPQKRMSLSDGEIHEKFKLSQQDLTPLNE